MTEQPDSTLPPDRGSDRPRKSSRAWIFVLAGLAAVAGVYLLDHYRLTRLERSFQPKLTWQHNFQAASAEANRSGRPMFIVFTQPNCAPCWRLKNDHLQSPRFESLARDTVVLAELDVRDKHDGDLLAGYGGQATPFIVLIEPDGTLIDSADRYLDATEWLSAALRRRSGETTTR